MAKIVLFNKPCRVLSQFRAHEGKMTLAEFFTDKSLRLAGRLDYESEGLLVLSDDGKLVQQISDPKFGKPKTYWAQVEGEIDDAAAEQLRKGVELNDRSTRDASVDLIAEPENLWPRDPPIRYRVSIPTSWVQITICEGKNRQVRRMTAAVGFPTLRLIRMAMADWELDNLQPGEYKIFET